MGFYGGRGWIFDQFGVQLLSNVIVHEVQFHGDSNLGITTRYAVLDNCLVTVSGRTEI